MINEENRLLGTHEYRAILGVTAKNGRSSLDTAVVRLQMTFDVTTVGNVDMLDKNGNPYNKAVAFDKIENWVHHEWMTINPRMEHREALEKIYQQAERVSKTGQAQKAFDKSLELYKSFN